MLLPQNEQEESHVQALIATENIPVWGYGRSQQMGNPFVVLRYRNPGTWGTPPAKSTAISTEETRIVSQNFLVNLIHGHIAALLIVSDHTNNLLLKEDFEDSPDNGI